MVALISQENAKYFKNQMHVDHFFMSFNPETKTITMANELIKWQTARLIQEKLSNRSFLKHFSIFDPTIHELYKELTDYRANNYTIISDKGDALEQYADKLTEFQMFVEEHSDKPDAVLAKSKALFETSDENSFQNAIGIDIEIYKKLLLLVEHTKDICVILDDLDVFHNHSFTPNLEMEQEIKRFLKYKNYQPLTLSAPTLPVTEELETMEA